MIYRFLTACVFLLSTSTAQAQLVNKETFDLEGYLVCADTGRVVLVYYDKSNEKRSDTATIRGSHFQFKGTVNRICEASLWTDLKNRVVDDPSVIRFLLEPGKTVIKKNRYDDKVTIHAGSVEREKDLWDAKKLGLLNLRTDVDNVFDSLYRIRRIVSDSNINQQLRKIRLRSDSLLSEIRKADLQYVLENGGSHLSAYLLSTHQRRLSVDSLQTFYSMLSDPVKRSTLGFNILRYLYPLANNSFKAKNTLVGPRLDSILINTKSVYDLLAENEAGEQLSLRRFQGRFSVMGFWASWCKPCVKNIGNWNLMADRYRKDNIEFIYISLDKNKETWKRMLQKYHPVGTQLISTDAFLSEIALYCKVLWVATYVLVAPDGRILEFDIPHPGEAGFEKLMERVINQPNDILKPPSHLTSTQ